MPNYTITVLPGDGVGHELIACQKRIIDAAAEKFDFKVVYQEGLIGKSAFELCGDTLPQKSIDLISSSHMTILGSVDTKFTSAPSPVGKMRKVCKLYADFRHVKSFDGAKAFHKNIDIVFIRESTEGFLSDRNLFKGHGEFMPDENTAMSLRVITKEASTRIAQYAFDFCIAHNRKKITVAHKMNVFKMSCGLFWECANQVKKKYPGIELEEQLADEMAHDLILSPENYDVILTTNLLGDLLSDEASALVHDLTASANIGKDTNIYFPVNHSARYSMANKGLINPLPSLLCLSLALSDLGQEKAGKDLNTAIARFIQEYGADHKNTNFVLGKIRELYCE